MEPKKEHKCLRCQYVWWSAKKSDPVACPACKSYRWSIPKKEEEIKKEETK